MSKRIRTPHQSKGAKAVAKQRNLQRKYLLRKPSSDQGITRNEALSNHDVTQYKAKTTLWNRVWNAIGSAFNF